MARKKQCKHNLDPDDCAACYALAEIESGRCKHGIDRRECAECDSRGDFDSGERDVFDRCEHGQKWTEACQACDGSNGTVPEPIDTVNAPLKSTGDVWKSTFSGVSCEHTPDKPVVTINGCAVHACRESRASDWQQVPSYHLLIDCTSDGGKVLHLPPALRHLQRYVKTDEWTIGIPWRDYGTPPLEFGFWRALVKKLPRNGVCVVTCIGAHGRTGTAIAALLLAANPGMSDLKAIATVRAGHCDKAVEAMCQKQYLKEMALKFATPAQRKAINAEHAANEAALKALTDKRVAESKRSKDKDVLYAATPAGVQVNHFAAACLKGESHTGRCDYGTCGALGWDSAE